ncbi:MAG: type II toxin-antitoxin system VapC family toxin [Candidatus Binataceae bacterium]
MRPLLLDSNALLWWVQDNRRLGAKARLLIEDTATLIFVSAASIWEIAIKSALGRIEMDQAPEKSLPGAIEAGGFRELQITIAHALAAAALPKHHADPFDRMLVAQAQIENLAIVTADAAFEKYDAPIIDATR